MAAFIVARYFDSEGDIKNLNNIKATCENVYNYIFWKLFNRYELQLK